MKKVLALVLATVMAIGMSTVAFAARVVEAPGEKIVMQNDWFLNAIGTLDAHAGGASDLSDSYTVSAKWTKGGAMVSNVQYDKDLNKFVIKLNENYTLEDEKALVGTVTVTYKKDKTLKFELKLAEGDFGVTNNTDDLTTYDNWDDAESGSTNPVNNTVYTADGSGRVVLESDSSLLQVKASVKDEQKIFMSLDEKTVYDIIDYLDDKNIDYDELDNYNVKGKFSFSSGKAETIIHSDFSKKPYIYAWDGSKLSEVKGAKWNDGEGTYTCAITGPTQYVLSNKALIAEKAESSKDETSDNTQTTNPDTGANDFVGLAVALAVVSVAGIAVAKKH